MRIVLLIALAAGSISAAPIANLFNTGHSGPDGADQNWMVDGGKAFVTDESATHFRFGMEVGPRVGSAPGLATMV